MKNRVKKKFPGIQYFRTSLSNIVLAWSRNFMERKDWEVEAIDVSRDTVVLRRYQSQEEI